MAYKDYEPKLKELFKQLDEAGKTLKVAENKKEEAIKVLEVAEENMALAEATYKGVKGDDVVHLPTYKVITGHMAGARDLVSKCRIDLLAVNQQIDRVKAVIVTLKANYEALVEAQRKSLNNVLQFKNGKRKSKRPNKARS